MQTDATAPSRPSRRARRAIAGLLAFAAVGATGLEVRSTPTVSLRVPEGWHVLTSRALPGSGDETGLLALAGPRGQSFSLSWAPSGIGYGCPGTCPPTSLSPLATTFDSRPVVLFPWGTGGQAEIVANPVEQTVGGQPTYFDIECHPAASGAERVCADIVSSIGWSPPLFAGLRSDVAVVAIR